jgi:hypothetical protein
MNGLPGPPQVDGPRYGGQLWPSTQSGGVTGSPHPQHPPAEPGPQNRRPWGRALIVVLAVLAVGAGAFVAGWRTGPAVADAQSSTTGSQKTYEEGLAEGMKTGRDAGYASGLTEGRANGLEAGQKHAYADGYGEGKAAGRDVGYQDGYAKGKSDGYRSGLVQGCQAVFDELKTDKVIDHPAGPYEKYWYLTKGQCLRMGTW